MSFPGFPRPGGARGANLVQDIVSRVQPNYRDDGTLSSERERNNNVSSHGVSLRAKIAFPGKRVVCTFAEKVFVLYGMFFFSMVFGVRLCLLISDALYAVFFRLGSLFVIFHVSGNFMQFSAKYFITLFN